MKHRITDLRNFLALSGSGTIGEAAHKLGISQPALSESLKRLEEDCGGSRLFYRSRQGIRMTPSGRAFLPKARHVLQALRDLEAVESDNEVFAGRQISIGCHHTVAQYTVPGALAALRKKAPDYNVRLVHDLSRNIQAGVQSGALDVGVVINPSSVPDLVIQKVESDLVGVWSSEVRADQNTIICDPNLFQTQSILRRWKNKPQKLIATDSLELIGRLTFEGLGHGILPERAVKVQGLRLKLIKSLPTYQDEIALIFRPEFGKTKAERFVLEVLKEPFRSK